ncbi:MAG: SWIM zinc finger family protein [Cyanosarcina radialis HA8281-LM2]|jgi:uncharacterized Zn finger protein|nr:SWIM zinc finger family protein [Cyanosarcina radialis HA8281-LM2]
MPLPPITEDTIRHHANANSFSRGQAYYDSGAVLDIVQRDDRIQAAIEGSEARPYRVNLQFDAGGITAASCSCLYNYDGWCKHIVATLLTCIRQPDAITVRPSLAQLLDRLDHLQTQRLVQDLVQEHPELIDTIDDRVALLTLPTPAPAKTPKTRRTAIDPAPFRRQVRQIIRAAINSAEEGYEEVSVAEELLDLIDKAQEFTDRGDCQSAIAILEVITSACADEWNELADYGLDSAEVESYLNEAWSNAILSDDLTADERAHLQETIEEWQDSIGSFKMSLTALEQGWHYPPLQRVLQGEIGTHGAWEAERPEYADDLALVRLRILDRQSRDREYLNLALAESQTTEYLLKLVRLGQIETAMRQAQALMTTQAEAFALAKALREQQQVTEALAIAKAGLSLSVPSTRDPFDFTFSAKPIHNPFEFASWTSDLAEGLGDTQTAIEARIVAFQKQPSFQEYRKLEALAGQRWPSLKSELLQSLRQSYPWGAETAKVDIFLHEGAIEDAIEAVRSTTTSYYSHLVRRVMTAAIESHPEWAIAEGKRRAEPTMDGKKSDRYQDAVDWLKQVRAGYLQLGQEAQWTAYRQELVNAHGRKYKLMELFKQKGME